MADLATSAQKLGSRHAETTGYPLHDDQEVAHVLGVDVTPGLHALYLDSYVGTDQWFDDAGHAAVQAGMDFYMACIARAAEQLADKAGAVPVHEPCEFCDDSGWLLIEATTDMDGNDVTDTEQWEPCHCVIGQAQQRKD